MDLSWAGSGFLVLMVLTYARTEWIGAMAAFSIIGLLRYRRLFLIGVVVGLFLIFAVPAVQSRLKGEMATDSFEWRLKVWNASLTILKNPTLIGSGLDTSPILVNNVLVNVIAPPHNEYFRTMIETGIIGFLVFLLLQAALLYQGWIAFSTSLSKSTKVLGLTLLAVTVGGMIISLSDNYFDYVAPQWFNWTIVGLLAVSIEDKIRKKGQ